MEGKLKASVVFHLNLRFWQNTPVKLTGQNGSSEEKSGEDIIEADRTDDIMFEKVNKSRRKNSLQ